MSDQSVPYPPLSGEDAQYPKCGGALRRKWMPRHTAPWLGFCWSEFMFSNNAPEWMLRTRILCRFRRAEMCADADTQDVP